MMENLLKWFFPNNFAASKGIEEICMVGAISAKKIRSFLDMGMKAIIINEIATVCRTGMSPINVKVNIQVTIIEPPGTLVRTRKIASDEIADSI
jgi:hypothetical protein